VTRSITTFTNRLGEWAWDTGGTQTLVEGPVIEDFADFIRQINEQRRLHILMGEPYRVTQELLPQGGATP
jgi:hypothetical protein